MASQADARCASRHTALSIWSRRETIVHSVVSLQTTSSVNVSLSCSITGCIESKLHACPTETELLRAESGNNLAWYCLLLLWMRPETFFLCVYACVHLRVCRNSSYVLLLGTERNIFLFFPSSNGWVSLRVRDSVKTWWPPVVGAFLSILYKCTSRSLGFFFFFFYLIFFLSIGEMLTVGCEILRTGHFGTWTNRKKENRPVYALIVILTWNTAQPWNDQEFRGRIYIMLAHWRTAYNS